MHPLGYDPVRIEKAASVYLTCAVACMLEMPEHYAPQILKDGPGANTDRTFDVVRNHARGVRHLMIDKSPSWKRTCKLLGIKHTYKALEAWLRGGNP